MELELAVNDKSLQNDLQCMDFYRFNNWLIANLSLQEYYSMYGPRIALLFMDNLRALPRIGFSKLSAETIIAKDYNFEQHLICKDWTEWKGVNAIQWATNAVHKHDILHIIYKCGQFDISFRCGLNSLKVTNEFTFHFTKQCQSAYLAIYSPDIFHTSSGRCKISVMPATRITQWKKWKKQRENGIIQNVESTSDDSSPPKCIVCYDNDIKVLFLPCKHALCCKECAEQMLSEKEDALTRKKTSAFCTVCKVPLSGSGIIWFSRAKCLLCGCSQMNAVANGPGGCGCVIGCYQKASSQLKTGDPCPNCGQSIVNIIEIYLMSCD